MGRRIEEVIAAMPPEERAAVEARYQELREEMRRTSTRDEVPVARIDLSADDADERR